MRTKTLLDRLYAARSATHLANDPLSFCHRYADSADREVAGLIASAFAYGQVKIIIGNLEKIFSVMGDSPRRFVESFVPERGLARFAGFKHRFNDGRDLCALLLAIRTMLDEADTIGEYFLAGFDPAAPDITTALNCFSANVLAMDYAPIFGSPAIPADSYFPFLFPSPASGSACKRLCMYLRWMVRPADGIDLGLWTAISPVRLVIPVDAHIQRIGRFLGFTSRRQADWKMALEITAALRRLDPADPVKYDFSLAHLGISAGCDGTNLQACLNCTIAGICSGKPL
ncbi:MAG TPA: TIGR02757 family protein [Geobacteraceae bacterium]